MEIILESGRSQNSVLVEDNSLDRLTYSESSKERNKTFSLDVLTFELSIWMVQITLRAGCCAPRNVTILLLREE